MNQQYHMKWLAVGVLIALLNPLFSGLIIGFAYLTERTLRREGWLVIGLSVIWAIVVQVLRQWAYG